MEAGRSDGDGEGGDDDEGGGGGGGARAHRPAISGRLLAAASALALLVAACEDLNLPGTTLATSDLLILPLTAGAPEPDVVSFYVYNARPTTRSLIHNDGFNTPFAQVQFPSGSLESVDGKSLTLADSVLVTLTADPGVYGLHLAPAGLRFAALGKPALTFTYARYGDLSVATGSRYADQTAYAKALALWREASLDRWSDAGGSGAAGTDVRASLAQGGRYLVAAPR